MQARPVRSDNDDSKHQNCQRLSCTTGRFGGEGGGDGGWRGAEGAGGQHEEEGRSRHTHTYTRNNITYITTLAAFSFR